MPAPNPIPSSDRKRVKQDVRLADYDRGFQARLDGDMFEFDRQLAWRRGWLEADTQEEA